MLLFSVRRLGLAVRWAQNRNRNPKKKTSSEKRRLGKTRNTMFIDVLVLSQSAAFIPSLGLLARLPPWPVTCAASVRVQSCNPAQLCSQIVQTLYDTCILQSTVTLVKLQSQLIPATCVQYTLWNQG